MATLAERIVELLRRSPGLSDSEIADALGAVHQRVNSTARSMVSTGALRRETSAGSIRNYLLERAAPRLPVVTEASPTPLSEDWVKARVDEYLRANGWTTQVAWRKTRGVDIDAVRNSDRWLIEVKGIGSLSAMRVNYFIGMLGELLQRMDDPRAQYSIAVPDHPQFRSLWERLPALAKERNSLTAFFVSTEGVVSEVR